MIREVDSIFKLKEGTYLKVCPSNGRCRGCYFYMNEECANAETREYIGSCPWRIFVEIPKPKFKFLNKL